jgi:hypothetical protein
MNQKVTLFLLVTFLFSTTIVGLNGTEEIPECMRKMAEAVVLNREDDARARRMAELFMEREFLREQQGAYWAHFMQPVESMWPIEEMGRINARRIEADERRRKDLIARRLFLQRIQKYRSLRPDERDEWDALNREMGDL